MHDYLGYGNKMGEGWLLTGEMLELIHEGIPNIVCTQPFGCLPNHIVGKGMIRPLKDDYPDSNIVAIDYDPSATAINQENRIKLMLANARQKLRQEKGKATAAPEQKTLSAVYKNDSRESFRYIPAFPAGDYQTEQCAMASGHCAFPTREISVQRREKRIWRLNGSRLISGRFIWKNVSGFWKLPALRWSWRPRPCSARRAYCQNAVVSGAG